MTETGPQEMQPGEGSTYDSRKDTIAHIRQVRQLLAGAILELRDRALRHDRSKLVAPEKPVFDKVTLRLRELEYGSDEYKASLVEMGDALQHHYANNRHHPEHFEGGVYEMTLIDLIEMLADWKAAGMRSPGGDLASSIAVNAERFGYDERLASILLATADYLGWL
jgi:hypothetical protein